MKVSFRYVLLPVFCIIVKNFRTVEGVAVAKPVGADNFSFGCQRQMLLQIGGEKFQIAAAGPCNRIGLFIHSSQLNKFTYRGLVAGNQAGKMTQMDERETKRFRELVG